MNNKDKLKAIIALFCLVVSGVIVWNRARSVQGVDPKLVAEQLRADYLRKDAKALYTRLSEAEKNVNRLTESEFIGLCEELVFPKMSLWKVTLGETLTLGQGEEGLARFDVEIPGQAPMTQTLSVWVGPDGVANESVANLLFPIYYVEGLNRENRVRNAESGLKFRLEGLKRDRATLKKYGVNTFSGFSVEEGEYQSRDIDALIADWEKRLQEIKSTTD